MSPPPLHLAAMTATCAAGTGLNALAASLQTQTSFLRPCDFETVVLDTAIGRVEHLEDTELPRHLASFDCRNNRLAAMGLAQDQFTAQVQNCVAQVGAHRVGLFLGTSTSGMLQAELAYRECLPNGGALPAWFRYDDTHNTYSVAAFVRQALGLQGPSWVVSTACSSSAKVFATAERMVRMGMIDAAVVGGVDSLCLTTLYGFNSLQLLSRQPCRPYDVGRDGISIGEAAAFVLLTSSTSPEPSAPRLLGVGESSDAHHMSSPQPEGLGAQAAMQAALHQAGLMPTDLGYLNLHGTATPSNDKAEGCAVARLMGPHVPCSSTKGLTGHTLGAAGALEVIVTALALRHQTAWGSPNTQDVALDSGLDYVLHNRSTNMRYAMSNSFGFGGSNCSVLLGVDQ
jgi:3-oxoacyl-[acyl-carrier-protein] synthase-1